jgi:hypothetical protein
MKDITPDEPRTRGELMGVIEAESSADSLFDED